MTVAEWDSLLGSDWNPLLGQEFEKPYWADLRAFVAAERSRHSVYPPHDEVFTALCPTPCAEIKVVILGQETRTQAPARRTACAFRSVAAYGYHRRSRTSIESCSMTWAC